MKAKDLKYILAYITPLTCCMSFWANGIWSYSSAIILFGLLPLADQLIPKDTGNVSSGEELSRSKTLFFDILLYLNLPILYVLGYWYLDIITTQSLGIIDLTGKTLAYGLMSGVIGINVAHEIGHRPELHNQWISRLLLLPAQYMHFNIEHNRGHHKNVATPDDPASSRKGESFYTFWLRTVYNSYKSAWRIENQDLSRSGRSNVGLHNKMVIFTIMQLALIIVIYFGFGAFATGMYLITAVLGFTLLEQVNYIEHYGLVRQKLPSGKYEPVQPHHSWNSNHEVGRVVLYELTRHSDHHFKSTRKYQVLRHFNETPQLPFGYPASIIMAMIPPIWFSVMDKRVEQYQAA